MTVWEWCHWRTRALRAEAELRDEKAARQATLDHYRTALLRVDAADAREKALQAALAGEREKVADLAFQLECMSVDNADLERVNEALRGGLQFFDPSQGAA